MATYYKYLDKRSKTTKKFPLKIAISHRKKTRYISTGYYLPESQWDEEKQKIQPPFKNCGSANAKVNRKYAITGEIIESLRPMFKQLHVDQIKQAVEAKIQQEFEDKASMEVPGILHVALNSDFGNSTCFFEYTNKLIPKYYISDKAGTAQVMERTITCLKAFTKKERLSFKTITEDFLRDYERWYIGRFNKRGKKNTVNGLGFHTRIIRVIYNLSIKDKETEVTRAMYPFGHGGYSIKKEKTAKRSIDPSEIAKLFELEIPAGKGLWHHLNYFKYYFECWGMNYMDLAYLRVYQVENGRLQYRRRKTKWSNNAKQFDIEHSPTAQKIIDHYTKGKKRTDFVFPIFDDIFHLNDSLDDKEQEAMNKRLFQEKLNSRRIYHVRRLKRLSKMAGIEENVSTYVGRHSFFSIALRNGVSKSEISELAGHSNYQITEHYLAGFNGEQLAASANIVRNAVAKHTGNGMGTLEDKIIRSDNGQEQTIIDFLDGIWSKSPEQKRNTKHLVIALLQKTDLPDVTKALQCVNHFLQNREKNNMASIADE